MQAILILVGLAVLYGALLILAEVLEILGNVGGSIVNRSKKLTIYWLGRKSLGHTAIIPQALRSQENLFPVKDKEMADLAKYDPKPYLTPNPYIEVFRSPLEKLSSAILEPSAKIDIDGMKAIMETSTSQPFDQIFSLLGTNPKYPQPAPKKPVDIAPPPSWNPWNFSVEDPYFEPPLWSGFFSFLNHFVHKAYNDQIQAVMNAITLKETQLEKVSNRNREMESLEKAACKRYEDANESLNLAYELSMESYREAALAYESAYRDSLDKASEHNQQIQLSNKDGMVNRVNLAMKLLSLPNYISRECETSFDPDSGILIHEHRFPDSSTIDWVKHVQLKSGLTMKSANQKEKKEAAVMLHPAIALRLAVEIAKLDNEDVVKGIAINGWAEYTERTTGQIKRAYCASLFATKEQILNLNLAALDPVEAFNALKGIFARSLEITPIAPIIRLDTNDPRFVDAKVVLAKMAEGENLASMDWEDFEHLCRELFERAFASTGAEVKVTQASRDQGVDAIVFDPDPLRGGKIVIQAKRYTNVVDVSAVRDLYGSVMNEGAVKGILVTTSHFGPEAYTFSKDKPLTLLNGSELLGLLEQHGYKFRIDILEARARM